MSTHNMFSWRIKKNINTFGFKKSILSRAMNYYKGQGLKKKGTTTLKNIPLDTIQQRFRSAYAFVQSDPNLHWVLFG